MTWKIIGVYFAVLLLSGCVLSTQWSDNLALTTHGTEANSEALNDGNLKTIATVEAKNERVFTLKFQDVLPVRKVIIHNANLFWFDVNYLDTETQEWKTFHSQRQRRKISNPHQRDISAQRAQAQFIIDRLDIQTNMIQIDVSRTVDDQIIPKPIREPGDQVLNMRMMSGGSYHPYFRVIKPAQAKLREIEVYHLAGN
jgi:hypothetical protein